MSKLLMAGILGVLLVLLGIMSWMVSPHPPPTPDPKEAAKQQKPNQEAQIKQQQEAMKAEMMNKRKTMVNADTSAKAKPASHLPNAPKSTGPAPGAMDISSHWTKHRKPGEEGLKELSDRKKQSLNTVPTALPLKQSN